MELSYNSHLLLVNKTKDGAYTLFLKMDLNATSVFLGAVNIAGMPKPTEMALGTVGIVAVLPILNVITSLFVRTRCPEI